MEETAVAVAGVRARRKAERPGEILEAAFEEFVLKGYAATRLEDVAARAGVTKGTIYFYFENKERVFEAVVSELSRPAMEEFNDPEQEWTDDLSADVEGLLGRLNRFCTENRTSREILRLLIAEANRFPALVDRHFDEFMRPVVERLRDRFNDAVAQGELRSEAISELPEVVLGPILALNVMMLLFENRIPLDPEGYRAAHRAVLLDGILARRDAVGRPTALVPPAPSDAEGWTEWRPFPDPRRGDLLVAPLGAGVFELRLSTGEPVLVGAGRNVASRMTTLIPAEITPIQRRTTSRRRFILSHLDRLEYRVMSCSSYEKARETAAGLDQRGHMFRA